MNALARPFGLALLLITVPALAAVSVTSPASGASVTSPFTLTATASACSSQPIVSMGYSFDSSAANTFISGSSISAAVAVPTGAHILRVKSWGNQGASCVTNVPITVVPAAAKASASPTPVTNVTVSSPASGAVVTSPFSLVAAGSLCSSEPIAAFGYSLDQSASTTFVYAQTVSAQITAAAGAHTLHVKSWGPQNAACDTDIVVNVVASTPTASGPTIPANAIAVKAIQNLSSWKEDFDTGTANGSGVASSSGTMALVTSPTVSGSARQFNTTYANYGGERYYANFGADTTVSNFVYDTWIYLAAPINDIANVEMDMNQVLANGQTVIFGFQCDGWSYTWDYTANTGSSPSNYKDQWLHTNQTCNPAKWSTNTWHHVQISYSHDGSGNVTYKSVWLDGVEQDINITAPSAFALGWGSSLITNLQIDGMTALPGSATVYLDNLTVYRW